MMVNHDCRVTRTPLPDGSYLYQHGENPEHTIVLWDQVAPSAEDNPEWYNRDALEEWLQEVHEYEQGKP